MWAFARLRVDASLWEAGEEGAAWERRRLEASLVARMRDSGGGWG